MTTPLPAPLRAADISRFALRAAQLEKFKPVVAYWCDYFIVNQILNKGLHTESDEAMTYTTNLMDKLERWKTDHPDNDAIHDDVAAQAYIEQFALETFTRADNTVRANKATAQTADTFRAAATFIDLITIWKSPLDADLAAKSKFAKFHALRIAKALKAGEDPNLSNPVQEEPAPELDPLSPNDPEVRRLGLQPTVEEASERGVSPPIFPVETYNSQPHQPAHGDVSPLETSPAEGYFPHVPTFTADTPPVPHPTATMAPDADVVMGSTSPAPPSQPQDYYANTPAYRPPPTQSPAPFPAQTPQPPTPRAPPSQAPTQPPQPQYHPMQQPQLPTPQPLQPPPQQQSYSSGYDDPRTYRRDDEAILAAQKHAKWAISALNFEDVDTAVRELRIALGSLGAR
ncbi:DUF605-domain-containing protein [Trichodelitschia bisporula]|uniref:DUF605-domain-containing protein n=1 Tax=Trichodelitschia bisporula TaxID=703511 RepID=A0A6G1I6Q1_9PEZI|nr:DUF605-domain-containing protein [Trichodelitschia bisporula]